MQRELAWNDTSEDEEEARLASMQEQWMARVEKGREHALVGLTLARAHGGRLPEGPLACILSFALHQGSSECTKAHVLACLSQQRGAPATAG